MPTANGATGPASFPSSVNFSVVCAAAKFDTGSSVMNIAAVTTTALLRKRDSPTKAIVAVPAGKRICADQVTVGDALRSLLRQQQRAKRPSIGLLTRTMSAIWIFDRPSLSILC